MRCMHDFGGAMSGEEESPSSSSSSSPPVCMAIGVGPPTHTSYKYPRAKTAGGPRVTEHTHPLTFRL